MRCAMSSVDSPCVGVCRLEAFVCVGCGRTLDEIAKWARMDDEERAAVVARETLKRIEGGA